MLCALILEGVSKFDDLGIYNAYKVPPRVLTPLPIIRAIDVQRFNLKETPPKLTACAFIARIRYRLKFRLMGTIYAI